ncbi:hypothetical protein TNCV_2902201 [Trichonephila clavipes]|nr:hypothetical protein TNCV_2902201 [Trichonephila clavipes]
MPLKLSQTLLVHFLQNSFCSGSLLHQRSTPIKFQAHRSNVSKTGGVSFIQNNLASPSSSEELMNAEPVLSGSPQSIRNISIRFRLYGNRFNSCRVIYSQFGLAIHQNDHQARRRFVEWAQNEIAVAPAFHKRILFSDEAHFWLNGYVNKQNCRIWSEANPQVYVETPLHPEKLTVWCAL